MKRSYHGYKASRPDYMGVRAILQSDGTRVVEEHVEAFNARKAKAVSSATVSVFGFIVLARLLSFVRFQQGQLGACVANSGVAGLKLVADCDPSRLDAYQKCLMLDGAWPNDAGTSAETFHRVVAGPGICREELHRYTDDPKRWQERSSLLALQDGYDARIDATHRILLGSGMADDSRASVDAGRPVMIGGPVSQAFEDAFDTLRAELVFDNLHPSIGGHEQLIVGYRESDGDLLVLNSWGADVGLRIFPGCSVYTERALRQQDEAFSIWKAPNYAAKAA